MASARKKTKRLQAKTVGRSPVWLKTVAIAKGGRSTVAGTFGAASPVVRIDPHTGKPVGAA